MPFQSVRSGAPVLLGKSIPCDSGLPPKAMPLSHSDASASAASDSGSGNGRRMSSTSISTAVPGGSADASVPSLEHSAAAASGVKRAAGSGGGASGCATACEVGHWCGAFPPAPKAVSGCCIFCALALLGRDVPGTLCDSTETAGDALAAPGVLLGCKKASGGCGVFDGGGRAAGAAVGGGGAFDSGGRAGSAAVMGGGGGPPPAAGAVRGCEDASSADSGVCDSGGRAGGAAVVGGGEAATGGVPCVGGAELRGRLDTAADSAAGAGRLLGSGNGSARPVMRGAAGCFCWPADSLGPPRPCMR